MSAHVIRTAWLLLAVVLAGCSAQATPSDANLRLTLDLAASSTEFVPESLSAPRNMPIRITFRNGSTEPHTLIFPEPISVDPGQLVAAGQTIVVELTTPAVGDYTFLCNVHEGMTGILRVN